MAPKYFPVQENYSKNIHLLLFTTFLTLHTMKFLQVDNCIQVIQSKYQWLLTARPKPFGLDLKPTSAIGYKMFCLTGKLGTKYICWTWTPAANKPLLLVKFLECSMTGRKIQNSYWSVNRPSAETAFINQVKKKRLHVS